MAKKIVFTYGVMSSCYRLQAENKLTAYATMVLQFNSNPQLVAIYEPTDLTKQDSWLMHSPVEQRLDEIFGGKGSFIKYLDEHEAEIKDLRKDYEKDLKETLLHYFETHPHCSEIIIVKPYFPADVFLCDQEDVEKLDCKVKLNLTV